MTHFQHQTLQQTSFPCRLIVKTYRVKNSLDEPNWVTTLEWNEIHVAVYEDSEPVVTGQPWHAIKGNMTSGSYPALCFLAEFSGMMECVDFQLYVHCLEKPEVLNQRSSVRSFRFKMLQEKCLLNLAICWGGKYLSYFVHMYTSSTEIPINWFQNIIFSELNKFPK